MIDSFENIDNRFGVKIDPDGYEKRLKEVSSYVRMYERDYELNENNSYKLKQTSGIPVIAERKYGLFGKFNKVYLYPFHEHTIIWGGSGSGKTQTVVYPLLQSILDARENAVIHDCKLELIEAFGSKFKEAGYNVIVINFTDPRHSHRWNPFDYPTKLWKDTLKSHGITNPQRFREVKPDLSRAIEVFKDCAINLCYEEDNDRNSYFWKGAGNMMAGACLLLAEEGKFDCINGRGIQMVYAMDKADQAKGTVLSKFISTCRQIDDESTIQINTYLNADVMTRGNIESTFRQKVDILSSNPDMRYITSGSDFDLIDIFEKQTVVFLLTQDFKDQYNPLVTLFLKQLYEVGCQLTLMGRYKSWPYKMNWVLEEMGVLPEIKNFKNIYNAARARGLTIYGFMQSMADMVDKYELTGTKTILENCRAQIVVHAENEDTRSYIRERVGKTLLWDKSSKRYKELPLLSEAKMNMFEKGKVIFTFAGQKPYIAKLPQYKQYSFYKEPDKRILYRSDMFGEEGRKYKENEIKWFEEMNAIIGRNSSINEFRRSSQPKSNAQGKLLKPLCETKQAERAYINKTIEMAE